MEQARNILHSYLGITQHMSRKFRSYFGRLDLTFPQALALIMLEEHGDMPISRLAQLTGSANSTVSGIVDRLEKSDLVRRERSPYDRRIIYVRLTDRYRAMQAEKPGGISAYFAEAFAGLSEQEQGDIADALARLNRVLEQA